MEVTISLTTWQISNFEVVARAFVCHDMKWHWLPYKNNKISLKTYQRKTLLLHSTICAEKEFSVPRHRLSEHTTSHNTFLLVRATSDAPSRLPPTTTWHAKPRFQTFCLNFKELFTWTLANCNGHVNGGVNPNLHSALTGWHFPNFFPYL